MRMWMVNPKKMCRKHLLGEHNEIHKAVGNLRKSERWAKALIAKKYLEPSSFIKRHAELVAEMKRRDYKHDSPLNIVAIALDYDEMNVKVNVRKSIADLRLRCKECVV